MPMSLPQPNSPSLVDASPANDIDRSPSEACARRAKQSCEREFTDEERWLLLRLAHDSVASALEGRAISLDPPTPHLAEPRGVFTSLYLQKALRGCVGYVLPNYSVFRAAAETARAAAFEDNRFPPVTQEEAARLEIQLSILSVPKPIQAEEIEIGRDGLLIGWHGRRGLLLPQVPVEHGWDRRTFLEQTCRKAGLPADAWQKGATIEGFSAEVFGGKGTH
jgi:AmmeMemoRadiSam system protein A